MSIVVRDMMRSTPPTIIKAAASLTIAIQANWFMLGDFDIAQSRTLQLRL